jgi:DNA repair exonuclease SbcCD nuclease subunit
MSNQLFKKAAVFTDIHFGKKNNDRQHNQDCEDFVKWFIEQAQAREVDTIIFTGDWHDNRHAIHVSTLNYSLSNMERLANAFPNFYFIPGNHDLYYKEKREISSVAIGRNLNNMTIINDFLTVGGVTFCPWLVGDDFKKIQKLAKKSDYMFGHFELPHFMMNAMVEMPDHGGLNHTYFDDVTYWAFSGHFHKRQAKNKICYLGNPFPHNFADAWDDERGMMFLEWGKDPEFINWKAGPKYRTLKISDLLESPTEYLDEMTYARITADVNINHDEAQFIKDTFQAHFNPRKIDVMPGAKEQDEQEFGDEVIFQSVDQIVIEGLKGIDSLTVDKNLLIEIYRGLS